MNAKEVLRNTIGTCHEVLTTYLSDLSDADLIVRPVPGSNHIAWQLGHLVSSEHNMLSQAGFKMPDLPEGFAESYTPETSSSDDPAKFLGKEQYLSLLTEQRTATLASLEALPEAELAKAAPESMREYAATIAAVFNIVGIHLLMHGGQFVVVRRKLGKPVLI